MQPISQQSAKFYVPLEQDDVAVNAAGNDDRAIAKHIVKCNGRRLSNSPKKKSAASLMKNIVSGKAISKFKISLNKCAISVRRLITIAGSIAMSEAQKFGYDVYRKTAPEKAPAPAETYQQGPEAAPPKPSRTFAYDADRASYVTDTDDSAPHYGSIAVPAYEPIGEKSAYGLTPSREGISPDAEKVCTSETHLYTLPDPDKSGKLIRRSPAQIREESDFQVFRAAVAARAIDGLSLLDAAKAVYAEDKAAPEDKAMQKTEAGILEKFNASKAIRKQSRPALRAEEPASPPVPSKNFAVNQVVVEDIPHQAQSNDDQEEYFSARL
jgi:hypothetical protein